MRAVNLIPPEERRGERAPSRTGPLAYVVVGALAVGLLAVTAVVMTQNTIADRKSEVASLTVQETEAKAQAGRFQAYADFASLQQARTQTVTSLAQSRFDWDRVLRELALVIPNDVFLTSLAGSVSPGSGVSSGSSATPAAATESGLRGQVAGPALEMNGCAGSQTAVAGFLTALRDIDGVTRVAVSDSTRSPRGSAAGGSTSGSSTCSAGKVAQFDIVVAFDSVPIDPATQAPAAPVATVPAVKQQSDKAHQAVSTLLPGTVSR